MTEYTGPERRETEKWQPIETAPKDGTPMLGFGIWMGEISGISKSPVIDIIESPAKSVDHDSSAEGWWNCVTGDAYVCWLKPTHWMPLPEPPE